MAAHDRQRHQSAYDEWCQLKEELEELQSYEVQPITRHERVMTLARRQADLELAALRVALQPIYSKRDAAEIMEAGMYHTDLEDGAGNAACFHRVLQFLKAS